MKNYLLIAGTCASRVTRETGLRAFDTPLGVLVEKKDEVAEAIRIGLQLEVIERALNPPPPRCECGGVIMHTPNCKMWNVIT